MGDTELYSNQGLGLPLRETGETVEDYHRFLRYALMPSGKRTVVETARILGMTVEEVMELALRWRWVDRVRAYDKQRLEELKVASASEMQGALREMLSAVASVAQRVREVAPNLEIGAHNVAQLMTAMGELVKAMQAISSGQPESGSGVTLRDVITVITGATQAKMVRGDSGVEIITDTGDSDSTVSIDSSISDTNDGSNSRYVDVSKTDR